MIAGSNFTLTFTAYDSDGISLLDLSGATIKWVISPFGQTNYTILQKTGVITGTGTFTVTLNSSDTASLSGKYIQQPVITDFLGNIFRPAQGTILILPRIVAS
jgi:hypothetical protein